MRIAILGFFASVFALPAMQMCFGTVLFGGIVAAEVGEFAPTPEDVRIAREMSDEAEAAGLDLRVSPAQVSQARRMDRMDDLERGLDLMLEREGALERGVDREPSEHVMPGAYYPDPEPASEAASGGSVWLWAVVAFGGVLAFLVALGAAFMALGSAQPPSDEPPEA